MTWHQLPRNWWSRSSVVLLLVLCGAWLTTTAAEPFAKTLVAATDLSPQRVVDAGRLSGVQMVPVAKQAFATALRIDCGPGGPAEPVVVDLPFSGDVQVGDQFEIAYSIRCPEAGSGRTAGVFLSVQARKPDWYNLFVKNRSLSSAWITERVRIVACRTIPRQAVFLNFELTSGTVFELAQVSVRRFGQLAAEPKAAQQPAKAGNLFAAFDQATIYGHGAGYAYRGVDRDGQLAEGITLVAPKIESDNDAGFHLRIAAPLLAGRPYLLTVPMRGRGRTPMLYCSIREPDAPYRQLGSRERTLVNRWELQYFRISTAADLPAGAYAFSVNIPSERLETVMVGPPTLVEGALPPVGAVVDTIAISGPP